MSGVLESIVRWLLDQPALVVYAVVAALVFAEDALFVGFLIPGETAAVIGGVEASRGRVSLTAMIVVVVAAAILGDSVGYEVGKHAGARILRRKVWDRHRERLDAARSFLARRGGLAVLLGRLTAFFRAVMPALAGVSQMPYRTFLLFNVMGGLLWGVGFVLLGFAAGDSYQRLEKSASRWALVAVAVVAVLGIVLVGLRRRRRSRPVRPR